MNSTSSIVLCCCLSASVAIGQTRPGIVAIPLAEQGMAQPVGQPLVMVHGIASTPDTWTTLAALMANDGWGIYTPPLGKFDSFVTNKVALNDYFYAHGLGSNTVLLGHSMGGIISRSSSRDNAVLGVVTIGTPHLGAPAARHLTTLADGNNPFFQTEMDLGFLRWRLEQIPDNGHEWANEWIGNWEVDRIRDRGYNAWYNLQFLNGPGMAVSLGNALGLGAGGEALGDLADNSDAISLLAQSAWQEGGSIRRAFTSIMAEGYVGHQFTFLMDPATADYYGNQMVNDGVQTYFDGWTMEMAGEFSGNWDMMYAGSAIMTLGDAETYYWVWWANTIIGSLTSDGVVPLWSQQGWPNVPAENIGSRFHTSETSGLAGELRGRVNQLFNH